MCLARVAYVTLDYLFALSFIGGFALLWASAHPWVALGVWLVVLAGWIAAAKRLRDANPEPRSTSLFPLFPTIFYIQYGLDRLVPFLGSALILGANLAALVHRLRASSFPTARARRSRPE